MTFSDAIAYIDALRPAGMQMGLERMERAVEQLSSPHKAFPCVHIAGTNGKGSTAAMIAAAMTANGYRTGLFTSPVVTSLCDLFQIDGHPIEEETFAACTERIINAGVRGVSEYEFLTLVMLCCFEQSKVDIAVIECCLGGKTDCTNVIPPPLCAVFTPIAIDHTTILGSTIAEIAAQKSGIIKASCDVVCAPDMHEDALGVIFEKAAALGVGVTLPSESAIRDIRVEAGKTRFYYGEAAVSLLLTGRHQPQNAITALTVLDHLQRRGYRTEPQTSIGAIEALTMPCRQEWIDRDAPLLLDGAHNPHGIQALCNTIEACFHEPIILVIGMLADKDVDTCLQMLSPFCKRIICCTPPDTNRALSATALAEIASRHHRAVSAIDDPIAALEDAKKAADQTPIVIGGSFYTASVVRRAVRSQ